MPVRQGRDSNGPYFQWGENGKKYYYDPKSNRSKEIARKKAARQGRAIKASQARAMFAHGGGSINYHQQYLICRQAYLDLID